MPALGARIGMWHFPQSSHRDNGEKLNLESETKHNWISNLQESGNVMLQFANNLVHLSPCELTLKIAIYAMRSTLFAPRWRSMGTGITVLAAGSWLSSYCRCCCTIILDISKYAHHSILYTIGHDIK